MLISQNYVSIITAVSHSEFDIPKPFRDFLEESNILARLDETSTTPTIQQELTESGELNVILHPTVANALVELSKAKDTSIKATFENAVLNHKDRHNIENRGAKILIKEKSGQIFQMPPL